MNRIEKFKEVTGRFGFRTKTKLGLWQIYRSYALSIRNSIVSSVIWEKMSERLSTSHECMFY